jgi:hypothetical protein
MNSDLVTIKELILLTTTDKALGVAFVEEGKVKDKVELWIPKSQVDRCTMKKKGDVGEVDVPRWLAEKNDLDYEDGDTNIRGAE